MVPHFVLGQEADSSRAFEVQGYFSEMPSALVQRIHEQWLVENEVHNRLNFFLYPLRGLKASLQLRNRFIAGNYFDKVPSYAESFGGDRGVADLSFNIATGKHYVCNTQVDRLYLEYSGAHVDITAGRQRINWAQTLVWNPNDIFNNYSFFDFDYIEKPGADALRIQFYPGARSNIELDAKVDSSKKATLAGLVKMNLLNYDFQLLAGVLHGRDLTLGLGWSGSIGGAAFRGEAGYYRPLKHFADSQAIVQLSLGSDYSFSNSLLLQAEVLYSYNPYRQNIGSLLLYYAAPLSAENLSFTDWNLFVQASYPITPLLNSSLALMSFPRVQGYYLGPSLSWSLASNLSLSGVVQIFSGRFMGIPGNSANRTTFSLSFLRLKFSF